jgi:hypothetical protein
MILSVNTDYFLEQRWQIDVSNGNEYGLNSQIFLDEDTAVVADLHSKPELKKHITSLPLKS